MTKHTPGPWGAVDDRIYAYVSHGNHLVALVTEVYALPYDYTNDIQPAHNREANARLIAAAPELLEALKRMLQDHGQVVEPSYAGTCACDACTFARKAFRQATE